METTEITRNRPDTRKTRRLATARRKHMKLICIITAVIILIAAAIMFVSVAKAHKVKDQIENKVFIAEYPDNGWVKLYAFKDGKIAIEDWYLNSLETSSDITVFDHKYKVVASIFSDKINIMTQYPHGWIETVTVYLDDEGVVHLYKFTSAMPDWHETTLESVETLRTKKLCDHDFGQAIITKTASCSSPGEETLTCKKCNYTQTRTIYVEHNYVNRECSLCGHRKEAEKSDLEPNTWYTSNDGVLHVQNCLVKSATTVDFGKAMIVQYYAVCQHCHAVSGMYFVAGPEVDYDIEKIYYCEECEMRTLVRLKID